MEFLVGGRHDEFTRCFFTMSIIIFLQIFPIFCVFLYAKLKEYDRHEEKGENTLLFLTGITYAKGGVLADWLLFLLFQTKIIWNFLYLDDLSKLQE